MIDKKMPLREAKMKLSAVQALIDMLREDFKENEHLIANMQKTQRDIEESLRNKGHEAKILREIVFIKEFVSEEFTELQNRIVMRTAESLRKDITVARRDELFCVVKKLKEKLVSRCGHPFVLQTRDSYRGSRSNDYEDGYRAYRLCVVCGLGESSISEESDECKVLCDSDTRLIKRDLRKETANGWIPFEEIREMFLKSAGNMNLVE